VVTEIYLHITFYFSILCEWQEIQPNGSHLNLLPSNQSILGFVSLDMVKIEDLINYFELCCFF